MAGSKDREKCYREVRNLSLKLAAPYAHCVDSIEDLASDAVLYVVEHEHKYRPELGCEFVTFAGAYMRLYMMTRARSQLRRKRLIVRVDQETQSDDWVEVAPTADDSLESLATRDAVAYLRKVIFLKLTPTQRRVFEAILAKDSAHAEDLMEYAKVTSVESIDAHKSGIRNTVRAAGEEIFLELGLTVRNRK